jgi:hypothetical protein
MRRSAGGRAEKDLHHRHLAARSTQPKPRREQAGLDQHQDRRWQSWHRFTTLALAALAVLALCAADTGSADDHGQPDLIRLTVNEIRRLINVLLIRPIHNIAHSLRWSQWRRRHQARARRSHYTRRPLNLEL